MGWPPKFGVVGRDSSLQAKGRRLDSPRARLKLGPDFQRVALLETEPRFPALRRGNWGPISRKIVEGCGVPSNFSMRDTFLLGREIFRANHFYKSLFEDVNSKGLTDLWCQGWVPNPPNADSFRPLAF